MVELLNPKPLKPKPWLEMINAKSFLVGDQGQSPDTRNLEINILPIIYSPLKFLSGVTFLIIYLV